MTNQLLKDISVAALMVAGDEIADTSVGRMTHRGDICPYVRRGQGKLSPSASFAQNARVDESVSWEVGESVNRVLGYPAERFTTSADLWAALLHRDDRELAQRVMSATSESDQHVFHYRLLDAAGEYRWIRDEFRVVRQSGGGEVLCVGCWMDLGGQDSVDNAALASEFRELELLVDVLAARAQQHLEKTYSAHLKQNLHLSQLRIRKLQEKLNPRGDDSLSNSSAVAALAPSMGEHGNGGRVKASNAESWHTVHELTNALINAQKRSATRSFPVAVVVAVMPQSARAPVQSMPLAALDAAGLGEQGILIVNAWHDSGQLIACLAIPPSVDTARLTHETIFQDPYRDACLLAWEWIAIADREDDHISVVTDALFAAQQQLALTLLNYHNNGRRDNDSAVELVLRAQPTAALDSLGRATLDWEVLLGVNTIDEPMQTPRELIAIATRYGLMCAVDAWVLRTTLDELGASGDVRDLPGMAINLSSQTWMNPATPDLLNRYVTRSVLRPRQLSFEIQEPTLAMGFATVCDQIEQIRTIGFRVTLDDFGVGDVSLNQLRDTELDAVKLSGGLIDGDGANPELLGAVAGMAMSLDLVTIGKHAQHQQTLQLLTKLGVHAVQGQVINPPVPFPDFLATLN